MQGNFLQNFLDPIARVWGNYSDTQFTSGCSTRKAGKKSGLRAPLKKKKNRLPK